MSGIKKHGKTVPWKRTDQVETLVLQQVLKDFAVVAKKKNSLKQDRQVLSDVQQNQTQRYYMK